MLKKGFKIHAKVYEIFWRTFSTGFENVTCKFVREKQREECQSQQNLFSEL